MDSIHFRPSRKYLFLLCLGSLGKIVPTISITLVWRSIISIQGISLDMIPSWIIYLIVLFLFIAALFDIVMAVLTYRNLHYEISADEIIVRSGIFTKVVKHVPFRTITNISTTRTFIEQLTGLGSLSIQTAGTGSRIPEEKLIGLNDVQVVYEYVAKELRRFRGALSPTQTEEQASVRSNELLIAILQELRAIRQVLSR